MVHGVRLRDGRAEWYRNRWVRSRQVAAALGEKWPGGPVHDDSDFAANTHIIRHAGRVLATVEAGPLPYQLTDELETVGPCDFGGKLPGGYAAHTKLDRRTGELHAIAYYWAWDYVQHVVIDAAGQVIRTANIPVPDGPMMHDFALTGRYVVLFDLPVTFSMDAVSAGRRLPYTWNAAHQARVGLLPRSGPATSVRWFEVEPAGCSTRSTPTTTGTGSSPTWSGTGARTTPPTWRARARSRWSGGPSTLAPARSAGRACTTGPRSSRASTTGSSASRTATGTAPPSARSAGTPSRSAATSPTGRSRTRCSSTTWPRQHRSARVRPGRHRR